MNVLLNRSFSRIGALCFAITHPTVNLAAEAGEHQDIQPTIIGSDRNANVIEQARSNALKSGNEI
jgi:23S rRNA G2445 N2-methylase RlmL